MSAARELTSAGKRVIVVEARDRIGGRVWTSRAWSDAPMDLGASWIHGHVGNPLTELAQRFDVPTEATDFYSLAPFGADGHAFSPQEFSALLVVYADMNRGLQELERQFAKALFEMSYDNPTHRPVLEAEGLRQWMAPQLEAYGELREASAQQGFLKRP